MQHGVPSDTVFDVIRSMLEASEASYEIKEHEPVYTSKEAARVRGTELKQGAKAMVFEADERPVLLVVAAHRRIDGKLFKKRYNVKDLRLLNPKEVDRITGLAVGSIPPFGRILGLPTYVDHSLLENEYIAFNAGSHRRSVIMRCRDYIDLVRPQIGEFSA